VPDYKRLVEIFHETFQHPVRTYPDAAPDEWELRYALIAEELEEYFQAAQAGDVVEIADALADLIYVVFGAALAHGIPIEEVFYEVHESNMSKLTNDGKVLRREDGKILKSDQYRPPDVARVLRNYVSPIQLQVGSPPMLLPKAPCGPDRPGRFA
jgi:predicted HAD superfamily Cof-like phosphohydrolase